MHVDPRSSLTAPGAATGSAGWGAALLLVVAVHLLVTLGTWLPMDQGEYLFAAERLLDARTFTLAAAGSGRLARIPWVPVDPAQPVRFRMLPVTPIALAPLVAIDRALGFGGPEKTGLVSHMQGHVFVFAALALLGIALRTAGASPKAQALAVASTGLAWPVLFVSRRAGAEPILLAWTALFLLGGELVRREGRRAGHALQCSSLLLLPWTHATGPSIGATLVASEALYGLGRARWRHLLALVVAFVIGEASFVGIWNAAYQGNWWAGGYAPFYATHAMLATRPFLPGFAEHLGSLLLEGPVPVLCALAAVSARAPVERRPLIVATVLSVLLSLFFATFHQAEPTRRLAVVWPVWGLAAGLALDRMALGGASSRLLVPAGGLVSFYWFLTIEGRYYLGPGGFFYPSVLWVRQLIELGPSVATLAPPVALVVLLVFAARRVDRLLADSSL
jgi:hypothetical protein